MKLSILRRRPSPALVISMVALFVSLSGVSYGVATGFIDSREIKNNEVRTRDLRNNDIRTRDLRNNEVRGIDIRNSTVQGRDIALNTVRGEDVNESTLAKVPSATSADSATFATTAANVNTLKVIPPTSVAEGASPVTLATHGPLTLSGRCEPGTGEASLAVASGENNSAAGGEPPPPAPAPPADEDIDAGDPPSPIAVSEPNALALGKVFASAPGGKAFTGLVAMYDSASGSCKFHGHLALQG